MQRVRIGLTGLALVFLLVLLGAVIRSFTSEDSVPLNLANQSTDADGTANGQEATEPLAELGVAPGSTDSGNDAAGTGGSGK